MIYRIVWTEDDYFVVHRAACPQAERFSGVVAADTIHDAVREIRGQVEDSECFEIPSDHLVLYCPQCKLADFADWWQRDWEKHLAS